VCQSCLSQRTQVQACDRHGTQHLTWKCRYCCQVSTSCWYPLIFN
jgi:hypothetical protein